MQIIKKKNLKNLNTFKLPVKAKFFFEFKKKEKIPLIFDYLNKEKIKNFFILGSGSNIIFLENSYDGLVIKVANNHTRWLDKNRVQVGAGRELDKFLLNLNKKGFFEIQSLSGIPGSIGAAVFGNVGAFGQEIKNFIETVEVYDIKEKKFKILSNNELNFNYRNSYLKENKNKYLIFSVIFNFSKYFFNKNFNSKDYTSLKDFFKKYNLKNVNKKDIRKEIIKIRRKIYPNINMYPNVGSTFQNSEISLSEFKKIKKQYPNIPHWELKNKKIKIPTAFLFDKVLNLNGKIFKNIKVHQVRPLFFINLGNATGKEFYNLCQKIKKNIKNKLGINIKEEIIYIK